MKERLDNGKGLLKERLADYRVDPPEEVWVSISGLLGRGNRRRMVVVILSAAATIALAVTLGITLLGPEPSREAREMLMEESGPGATLVPGDELAGTDEIAQPGVAGPDRPAAEFAVAEPVRPVSRPVVSGPVAAEVPGPAPHFLSPDVTPGRDAISRERLLAAILQDEASPADGVSGSTDGGAPVKKGGDGQASPGLLIPEEVRREKIHRWALAAVVSPLYSYRDAENQAAAGLPVRESGLLAYAGGINVSYQTDSRFSFESGIHFSRMGVDIGAVGMSRFETAFDMGPLNSNEAISNLVSVSNTVGNIVTRSGDVFVNNYKLNAQDAADAFKYASSVLYTDQTVRQQMDYLEVPFNLRYTLIDRDLQVQLVGGVSTNLLIHSQVAIETASGTSEIGYLANIRNVNYAGNAGVGMIYHIGGNFNLRLEPRFKYFLNSVNDASLPSTRPYAFGLYTGMSYLF